MSDLEQSMLKGKSPEDSIFYYHSSEDRFVLSYALFWVMTKSLKGKVTKDKNKQQEVKTHWVRTKSEQYDVFIEGENNEFIDAHGIFSCPLQWRIMSPSMPLIR